MADACTRNLNRQQIQNIGHTETAVNSCKLIGKELPPAYNDKKIDEGSTTSLSRLRLV